MTDELAQRLVFNLRLPRILTAVLLGMSLSAAGAVLQMIFGNPLVEPGFLGVSQGAAFGAAFSIIVFSGITWLVQPIAALFAFIGLGLSYMVARNVRFREQGIHTVVAQSVIEVERFVDALKLFKLGYSWAGPVSLVVPYDLSVVRPGTAWRGRSSRKVRLASAAVRM